MRQVARLGDRTTGNCIFDGPQEGVIISASPDVIANGPRQARVGDTVRANCGHTGVIQTGSPTCICNGSPIARINDSFSGIYSGTIVSASDNIFTD